jgi:hypothetical protein
MTVIVAATAINDKDFNDRCGGSVLYQDKGRSTSSEHPNYGFIQIKRTIFVSTVTKKRLHNLRLLKTPLWQK